MNADDVAAMFANREVADTPQSGARAGVRQPPPYAPRYARCTGCRMRYPLLWTGKLPAAGKWGYWCVWCWAEGQEVKPPPFEQLTLGES